jgi:hypothetical protein
MAFTLVYLSATVALLPLRHHLQHVAVRTRRLPAIYGSVKVEADVQNDLDFRTLVTAAQQSAEGLLELGGCSVYLREPIKLRGNETLRISNGTIAGDGHSLFQVSLNHAGLLELSDVSLVHKASTARKERRSLGAALYAYKGRVSLSRCSIFSEAGFGVWLVQRAHARLDCCDLLRMSRSSIVVFDRSSVEVVDSRILDSAPHGICARDRSRVAVRGSRIERAHLRAIYCYHSAQLAITDTYIGGTRSTEAAAVQIEALRPTLDAASVQISRVTFESNAGGDLAVAGAVTRQICPESRLVERRVTHGVT